MEEISDPPIHFLTNKDRCPRLLVQALESRGKINGVAQSAV